jgi:hypothetical protein
VPRTREAAGPALAAARSIAQISWRVDMALRDPRTLVFDTSVAEKL